MKKLLSLVVSVAIFATAFGITAAAKPIFPTQSASESLVQAKINLVESAKAEEALKASMGAGQKYSEEQIVDAFTYMNLHNYSHSAINEKMRSMGVYALDSSSSDSASAQSGTVSPMSSGSNVAISGSPFIYYDTNSSNWYITAGGYWSNSAWTGDLPLIWSGSVNVGGEDGYGIAFTQTSGNSGAFKGGWCTISNNGQNDTRTSSLRSDGNGSLGFGFRVQDFAYYNTSGLDYMGSHWSIVGKFDDNFTYFHGIATEYYVHTWSSSSINSVNFGVDGKKAGVSVDINNTSHYFTVFGADTSF